ncbi:MAG TPA: ATP-binding protein [Chitinophagaceae bacterium]|nr:ATP-binding protein [Chitinophagaceae bacterium]HNU14575.1 ATP-binding protein [Chitinophagaceae bacterium]
MKEAANTSVLVIDDEELVRNDIEEILMPRKSTAENESVGLAASILFNTPSSPANKRKSNIPSFTVHKAANGMEGLEMVKRSVSKGAPYAVIFLDMRMPGWDGMETAEQIRKFDTKAEIIFVTAFSDNSIDDIVARAGQNVGYHCKPYASEEITQLATKAVTDYNKLRNLEKLIQTISSISVNEQHLTSLLRNILDQLVTYVETDMALLGKLHDNAEYEKLFSIGAIEEKIDLRELIARVKSAQVADGSVVQLGDVVLARLNNYSIFAVLKDHEQLKTEKLYLLKLFVLNAAKAIHNAELHEKLLQKEKLSAVGKAVSMMMHDLRSPIKNIKVLTDMMRQEHPGNEWLDMIDECGTQASEIFEDFLDFIKETPVKKLPVSLNKVIDEALKSTEGRNTNGLVTIHKNIPDNLMTEGDESKLKRVFINLLNNSIDALTDNKIFQPSIDITAKTDKTDNHVTISVHDNGLGIHPEIIKTLFEPFVTKQKSNGTGLGLAIVKQYITAHGGEIKADNNNGAVFTITIPLKK